VVARGWGSRGTHLRERIVAHKESLQFSHFFPALHRAVWQMGFHGNRQNLSRELEFGFQNTFPALKLCFGTK